MKLPFMPTACRCFTRTASLRTRRDPSPSFRRSVLSFRRNRIDGFAPLRLSTSTIPIDFARKEGFSKALKAIRQALISSHPARVISSLFVNVRCGRVTRDYLRRRRRTRCSWELIKTHGPERSRGLGAVVDGDRIDGWTLALRSTFPAPFLIHPFPSVRRSILRSAE